MPPVSTEILPSDFLRGRRLETHPFAEAADTEFIRFAWRTGIVNFQQEEEPLRSFSLGVFTGTCYPDLPRPLLDLLTQWHYMEAYSGPVK